MKPEPTSPPSHVKKNGDRIEVEYQRTGEDYAAWQLYSWDKLISRAGRSLPSWFLRLWIWAVLCMIVLALIISLVVGSIGLFTEDKQLSPLLPIAFLLVVLFLALIHGVGPKSLSRSLARRALIRQLRLQSKEIPPRRQKVILAPGKVVEMYLDLRGKQETVLDWIVFDSIELGEQHVFFVTQSNVVLIIPQRAFMDEKAFLDFVETAWTFQRRARETSPAAPPTCPPPEVDHPEHRITTPSDNRIML